MKKIILLFSLVLVSSFIFSACSTPAQNPPPVSGETEKVVLPSPQATVTSVKDIEDQILNQLDQDKDINFDIQLKQLEAELN